VALSLEALGLEPTHSRQMFLAELDHLRNWPEARDSPLDWFTGLVALDAREVSDEELWQFARRCIESRCVFVSAWGPDCERLHDTFDHAYIEAEEAGAQPPFLMSSWHADSSLDEALWFALRHATSAHIPSADAGQVPFVAVTTSAQIADAIRQRTRDPRALYARVEADASERGTSQNTTIQGADDD
jgi:hypothetical protein